MFARLARSVHRLTLSATRTPAHLVGVVRPRPHRMMVRGYTVDAHSGAAAVENFVTDPETGLVTMGPRKVHHCEANAVFWITEQGLFARRHRVITRSPLQGVGA